jgi:hypothetical protein
MVSVCKSRMESRTRKVQKTSCTAETRSRTVNKSRMETEDRSREVSFTVCVPEERTRSCDVTVYDNVTEEVSESYTVCVPVKSTKEIQVKVCHKSPVTVDCCGNIVEEAADATPAAPATDKAADKSGDEA